MLYIFTLVWFQFSTEIVQGKENVVADARLRVNTISMLTILDAQRIPQEQKKNYKLEWKIYHHYDFKK